jgi:FAD/FMN-containing dehydrogenase/Fe-S oxidoreductase
VTIDGAPPHARQLESDLKAATTGPVRFDDATRAMYAADASNYRHVPIAVVQPRTTAEVVATLDVCRAHDVPVLPRGAGTSIGGQAINTAVIIDFTRHVNRVLDIDPAAATARVEPGVVLDDLRTEASAYGLTFGPDPSTHSRCTVGGMIGNNACGSHSVAWGKTVDNVEALEVVTYRGERLSVGPTPEPELARLCAEPGRRGQLYRDLRALRDRSGPAVASRFPDLPRRVSGYNLDQLLADRGFNLARALVGSEGTCATVLEATLRLVRPPRARALVVLGFPDAFVAADHVLAVLELQPLTVEGIDQGLVAALRARHPDEKDSSMLPPGRGWLYVETGAATRADAEAQARDMAARLGRLGATAVVLSDPAAMRRLWRIREDGAGILTRLPDGGEAWPGWEDSAVPPERLGGYLRALSALLAHHDRRGAYYGHFGEGCVHIRIDFDLLSAAGVQRFRRFVEEAADLVVAHGGSLSGEHGDGQARAELLPRMYPPEIIDAFAAFKAAWDPQDRMNPGGITAPRKLDDNLRVFVAPPTIDLRTSLAFHRDGGSFARATRRCVGVGKCVAASGGVMCPSYRVTGEEKHSTRGRARLLFEMANGQLVGGGWRSTEVRDALDLCLACKGCKQDCPVSVDMASYKSEFLAKHYARRVRPASHYSMGFLPLWLRFASLTPSLANAIGADRHASPVLKRLAGVAVERELPAVAAASLLRWFRRRTAPPHLATAPRVLLFPDTFTNFLEPTVGRAAVAVLEHLGYRVEVPARPVCCGLTWVSTGQLGIAKRVLAHTVRTLRPWVDDGVPVVVLEPSCAALLRADSPDLLPDNRVAERLSIQVRNLAELLKSHGGLPMAPGAARTRALVQVHCHQHAEVGYDDDRAVLNGMGVDAEVLDSGCCGLAGNFGFEHGHYDISMACAERVLLPAVRAAGSDVAILADGFSCRTQLRHATDSRPLHLAQLAARMLGVSDAQ